MKVNNALIQWAPFVPLFFGIGLIAAGLSDSVGEYVIAGAVMVIIVFPLFASFAGGELKKNKELAAEAQRDLERNSYYYVEKKNGSSVVYGPIDLENMVKLYKSDKISLLTSVKFGIESELKPLKEFKELTEGLEEFL